MNEQQASLGFELHMQDWRRHQLGTRPPPVTITYFYDYAAATAAKQELRSRYPESALVVLCIVRRDELRKTKVRKSRRSGKR